MFKVKLHFPVIEIYLKMIIDARHNQLISSIFRNKYKSYTKVEAKIDQTPKYLQSIAHMNFLIVDVCDPSFAGCRCPNF